MRNSGRIFEPSSAVVWALLAFNIGTFGSLRSGNKYLTLVGRARRLTDSHSDQSSAVPRQAAGKKRIT